MKTIKGKEIFINNKVDGSVESIVNEVITKDGASYRHYLRTRNGKTVIEFTIPISEKRMYRFGVQVLSIEWDSK